MRFTLTDPAPATAETHLDGYLKIQRIDRDDNLPVVKAWRGKSQKPFAHFRFESNERREAWIDRTVESYRQSLQQKAEYKKQRKADAEKMRASIDVGSLLHYSWGYDQTNCEFFEVVSLTKATATIRPIASESVPGSDGFMSCRMKPKPGAFIGEPMRKKITSYGASMKCGIATPTTPDAAHYCSWYA